MRLLAIVLIVASLAAPVVASEQFRDVPDDHWAAKSVDALAEKGIVKGYPDGTFNGDKPVTRYELAVVMEKMIEYMRESQKPLAPQPAPAQPETQQPQPAPAAQPATAKPGTATPPPDPVAFLKKGGFLTEDSVLLQKDLTKPVTADQLAQTFATVAAKLMEERVPPKVN